MWVSNKRRTRIDIFIITHTKKNTLKRKKESKKETILEHTLSSTFEYASTLRHGVKRDNKRHVYVHINYINVNIVITLLRAKKKKRVKNKIQNSVSSELKRRELRRTSTRLKGKSPVRNELCI